MSTFTFIKEDSQTREQILARIQQVHDKDSSSKLLYKLYKQLRIKDKISDSEAYAYYRQLSPDANKSCPVSICALRNTLLRLSSTSVQC